jgi:hypothetical protein
MKKQILSLFLIFSINTAIFAMDNFENEQQGKGQLRYVQKQMPRQYWVNCLDPISPQYNVDPFYRPNKFLELIGRFSSLLPNQIPFIMPGFHVYYQSDDGKVWIAGRRNNGIPNSQIIVKLFDAQDNRINLIVRGPEFNFSFAHTQRKLTEKRKHPPLNFTIPAGLQPFRQSDEQMQEGHGGDQADSRDGMGYDPLNFMGQYKYYNENIRNHMVRHQIRKQGGAYAEYAIAAYNPPLTMSGLIAAEAYLFLKYVNNTLVCYLFPNYPSKPYYNIIEEYLPSGKEKNYLKFMNFFKLDLESYINLFPFIYTSQVTEDEIEDRMKQNIRTARRIEDGRIKLIPPEKQAFYPPMVVESFNYRIALYLYEQAASIEIFSISHKLSLVEKFIDYLPADEPGINFFQPNSAKFWLDISENQVMNTFTQLNDKIQLYRFHISSHHLIEGEEIRKIQDKSKADQVYEQIIDQAQEEIYLEGDFNEFISLVNEIPENKIAYLSAMLFSISNNILYDIYASYGLDDLAMYGFYSVDDVDEFAEEWLDMDEEDKERVDTIRQGKRSILNSIFNPRKPTQEGLVKALNSLQKMKQRYEEIF